MSFGLPQGKLTTSEGFADRPWLQWLNLVHQTITAARQSGVTADRPTDFLYVGRRYYDTTLGKPIWLHAVRPTVWHDAAGASV